MTVDENYFTEKYGLTRTHSEVLLSADIVKPGKTLDLGMTWRRGMKTR